MAFRMMDFINSDEKDWMELNELNRQERRGQIVYKEMKKELNINIKQQVDDDFEKSYNKYIESGRHTVDVLEDNPHKEIYGSGFADGIRAASKLYDEVMTYIMMNDITYPNFILGYVNDTTKALNDILTSV